MTTTPGPNDEAFASQEQPRFDWSQMDLSRHGNVIERAGLLLELVTGCLRELDDVVRDFAEAMREVGALLEYEREPEVMRWALTLTGTGFRARGAVEIELRTANTISVVAQPAGQPAMRYELAMDRIEAFPEELRTEFRAALVSSVLDAPRIRRA